MYGAEGKDTMDQFGQENISYGSFNDYGSWVTVMFLETFALALIGFGFAIFGYVYTKERKRESVDKQNVEMVKF